jgi:Exopolyphosphatase-related proteins
MGCLCIYHGNCADGFGAAWVVRKALGDFAEFHAGVYQNPPPDVIGQHVLLVDFSYKRPVLFEMAEKAKSVLVIDHHKTAAEELAGLPPPPCSGYDPVALDEYARANNGPPVYAIFDMERSGAGLTWDTFFLRENRPPLINHIEDRDLWRFKLDRTREIQAAVFSYPYDFAVWDRLMSMSLQELAKQGEAIERKHFKDIEELLPVVTAWKEIGGVHVPMANLPYTLTSDAGHRLCEIHGVPFAGCYWDTPEGRVYSLRSLPDGADVSEIAKQYGGGGHKHAAGFRTPRDDDFPFGPGRREH